MENPVTVKMGQLNFLLMEMLSEMNGIVTKARWRKTCTCAGTGLENPPKWLCVCGFVHMYTHVHTHAYVCLCIHECVYMCLHTCTFMHVCAICIYLHIYIYMSFIAHSQMGTFLLWVHLLIWKVKFKNISTRSGNIHSS